jgi:hypothetical protein
LRVRPLISKRIGGIAMGNERTPVEHYERLCRV